MQRKNTIKRRRTTWITTLSFGALTGFIVLGIRAPHSAAAASPAPPFSERQRQARPPSQETLLQHFISRTLVQQEPTESGALYRQPPVPAATDNPVDTANAQPLAPGQPMSGLTAATVKISLILGVMIGFLGIGRYVLHRYNFKPHLLGKKGHTLRVIARVPLTSKVVVALLEVPGKLLVIGTTGSTVVALGEIPIAEAAQPDAEHRPPSPSFAATLDQQTQTSRNWDTSDDALAAMTEHIQRKVSGMKQL